MNRSNRLKTIAGLACGVVLFCTLNSRAGTVLGTVCTSVIYWHIKGFGDTFTPTTNSPTNSPAGYLTDAGTNYSFIYKGLPQPAWVLNPYQDGTTWNGYPAIALEIHPTGTPLPANDDGTDKANIAVGYLPITQDSYYGFSMMLGNFGVPNVDILLAQWWQGVPYSPPLSLNMVPGSTTFACEMQIRNNTTGSYPNENVIHVPVGTCPPGQWQQFVVYAHPHFVGAPGTGEVKVWHNNMTTPVVDWTGDVGYNPAAAVTTGPPQGTALPSTNWTMYFGPYGDHDTINRQTYWANIAIASTREGANPNQ